MINSYPPQIARLLSGMKYSVCMALLLSLLTGCDFLKKYLPSSDPVPEKIIPQSAPSNTLFIGQSEEDIIELLGKPSGTFTITNKTVLMYNGELLEFIDGKLITPKTNFFAQAGISKETPEELKAAEGFSSKIKEAQQWVRKKTSSSPKTGKEFFVMDQRNNKVDHSRLITPGKITVVDFYATWCGPCKRMTPILHDMTKSQPDVTLRKVDIGNWGSETSSKYNISSVPNIRVFDASGKMVGPPTSDPNKVAQYIKMAQTKK